MVFECKTKEDFDACINNSKYEVTLVDFTAKWCPPCRQIKPFFDELSQKFSQIQFLKVDVDENDEVTQEAGVRAMPTFLVYKGGKKTTTKLEGANRDALARLVESLAQSISSKQTVSRTPTPFVSVSTVAKSSEFSPTSTQPARKPTGWCCIL